MENTQVSSKKNIMIWAIVIIAIGGLIWVLSTINSSGNNVAPIDDIVIDPQGEQIADHVKGNQESSVVLMEYSDFQCPACRSYFPIVKEILEQRGEQIAFVYRNYPLSSIHKNAQIAAQAAEAAGLQGKFWEMHDQLFENQNSWSNSNNARATFSKYAEEIGLSVEQFEADLDSNKVRAKVQSDTAAAKSVGSTGTPTFVLNGKKLDGVPSNTDAFIEIIDQAISDSGESIISSDAMETNVEVKKAE